MAFRIDFSKKALEHLSGLEPRHQATILDSLEEQLAHEPTVETRNRKPMRPNPIAAWELRIGDFRVYYDVVTEPDPAVSVLAIGVKSHNRVTIGGVEVHL